MIKKVGAVLAVAAAGTALAACGGGSTGSANQSSTAESVGGFDRAFIDAMVPHHRAAIAMAQRAEAAGLREPALMSIALNIEESQQEEIDTMLRWRKRWYGSSKIDAKGAAPLGLSMDEMGMSHEHADFSRVHDVDATFASMMVDHHRGAVRMAEMALEHGSHAQIKRLARRIIAAQKREITTLERHRSSGHSMEGMGTG